MDRQVGHEQELTRDRFDVFMSHCADVGIKVEWEPLAVRGHCVVRENRIVLNRRLTFAQAASTGMHEFGHWSFGDLVSTPAAERRAWEYGASLLIEAEEYARAESVVGSDARALALELEVTVKLIHSWRAWWKRRGHLGQGNRLEGVGDGAGRCDVEVWQ